MPGLEAALWAMAGCLVGLLVGFGAASRERRRRLDDRRAWLESVIALRRKYGYE